MTSGRTLLAGRRLWIAAGSMSLALTGVIAQQLLPTAAEATPAVSARAASGPTVVEPSTDPVLAVPAVPAVIPAEAASPSPAAAPVRPVTKPAGTPTKTIPRRAAVSDICSGPGWQTRRGQLALSTLRDTGQRSGVTVAFKGARAGYLGLTYPERHHVDVFVRSCSAESMTLLRHVMSHEMGHAFDAAHMTAAERRAYMAMRGIPAGTPWFGCNYCTDFATPAGDFAETYSQWQRSSRDSRSKIAPMPNASQLAAIAAAFFQG
ncbi:MAG: hypothetical protein JJD92_08295 [Frankiaceae bacterium]|nr:hypothetical protein [Frankiaceae bacterium]